MKTSFFEVIASDVYRYSGKKSAGAFLKIYVFKANKGLPIIGDNVYIGPGAKIIGNLTIGNHAAVGANAVVTTSCPDYAVIWACPRKLYR